MSNAEFNLRISKGVQLEKSFEELLIAYDVPYWKSGRENWTEYNNPFCKIRNMKDPTSVSIRNYPDFTVVLNNYSVFVDCKNSSGIERDAYNYLLKLENNGYNVYIFCRNEKLCKPSEMKFKKLSDFDFASQMNVPVTENVWRRPDLLSPDQQYSYKKKMKEKGRTTSGNAYAFIDFDSSNFSNTDTFFNI